MDTQAPTVSISLSRKVNLGNYESADLFLCVSNVQEGTTTEDIRKLMDTGQLAYSVLREEMNAKINDLKTK